jgi:transposase InsO family protein
VIEALADVTLFRRTPEHIRSDNGPEFVAEDLRKRLGKAGTGTLYIEPGSPWENGYCESFNGKLRDYIRFVWQAPNFTSESCARTQGRVSISRITGHDK